MEINNLQTDVQTVNPQHNEVIEMALTIKQIQISTESMKQQFSQFLDVFA